jgi:E3 ubiquitin-protein ligase SHPRH
MAMELLIRGDSDDDDDDDDKGKVEDIGVVRGKDKNDNDDNRHRRRRRPSSSKQNWPTTTTTTKKKKNKGKTVRFFCTSRSNLNDPPNKRGNDDDENVDVVTTVMIPKHPEIRIVRENAVPNNNTGVVAIYQYLDTSSSSPDPLQSQWLLLHEYHPPPSSSLSAPSSSFVFRHYIVREVAEDDSRNSTHHSMVVNETTDAAAVVVIPLQSRQAVQEALPLLFRFMMNPTQNENHDTMMDDDNHEHSNNHNNNNIYYDEEFRHALLESVVQHQTMRLEMMIQHHHSENPRIKHDRKEEDQQHDNTGIPCSITIRIYLTRHAMTLSQSIGRPSASRHSYEILLARFLSPNNTTNNTRDDDDDNNNNNHGSKSDLSSTINTAKHVYALTDNVQLQKSLLRQSSSLLLPDSTIPGLVPTLRGYQQHAVSWMLQRETTTTVPTDDEWQIAWSVLQFQEDENQKQSSRQLKAIPLYQYLAHTTKTDTEQKQIHLDSSTSNILLYSPILGWWADSVTMAKALTVSSPSIRRRGGSGILAESMGLGKTVEVLACILANPKPQSASSTTTMLSFPFSTTSNTETAKRRLEFGDIDDDDDDDGRSINCPTTDDPNPDPEESNKDVKPIQQATVGMVRDMEEFGDAEDEESSGKEEESSVCSALMMGDDGEAAERKDIDSHAALVTPGKEDRHCPQRSVEIRWVDEDILGTCICGDIIGFSTHKSKNDKSADAIVICHSCQEPMHTRCCCFGTFHKEANDCHYSQWLEYRQTYSNLSLSCRLVDERFCPCCFGSRNSGNIPSVESRATLIITPPAILNQWEREIFRHTTSRSRNIFNNESCSRLRVVIYEGIQTIISQQQRCRSKEQRSRSMELLHPLRLADADIVLMTFDALMRDLGHSDENRFVVAQQEQQDRAYLRKRKKYRVVPSPLLSVHWWRVCLDEAQRVENVTGAAKMACKLSTVHRWCVSGTPVGRGKLEDLYGLLLFLRLEPFDNKIWFRKCFLDSSIDLSSFLGNVDSRISHLLSNLFWRSTKKFDLVREQMGIPEQVEKKIVLQFSSIEKHFYDRQLEHAMSAAGDLVDKRGRTKKGKSCLNLLNEHLYRLRAACCHPQVGTGGIGAVKKLKSSRAAAFPRNVSGNKDAGVGSRVMTMSQILDKFIDDAKLQCEEALRLVVLHTNAMAALSKLKVEAKTRNDINIPESDQALLEQSCNLYLESLRLSDENAVPTLVTGEANLSGSIGFRMPHQVVNTCLIKADWKFAGVVSCTQEPWFKCDFTLGPARKITQLRLRSITKVPLDVLQEASEYNYSWQVVQAKECVFQCASLGGEYVDVHTFTMPCWQGSRNIERDWVVEGGFRTNKSKSWRLVVKSLHTRENEVEKQGDENFYGTYLGMDVEFFEATIASDPLQRLHCLHNASLSFSSLLQLQETGNFDQDASDLRCTPIKTRQKIDVMTKEAEKIESLYLDAARAMHNSFRCRLTDVSNIRKKCEQNLFSLASNQGRNSPSDCWDDEWWDDFLSICVMNGAETGQQEVVQRLLNDIEGVVRSGLHAEHVERNEVPFAVFHDIHGLQLAFKMRMQSIRLGLGNKRTQRKTAFLDEGQSQGQREGRFRRASGAHGQCIASIAQLSPYPSSAEMVENSHCKICKADWLVLSHRLNFSFK